MDSRVELILLLIKRGFEIDERYGEDDERWRLNLPNKNYKPSQFIFSVNDWSVFIYKNTSDVMIWRDSGFYSLGNDFKGKIKNVYQLEVILETLGI